MSLRTALMDGLKNAMRDKDQARVDAIRLIIAKMKEQDIAARPSGNADGINDEQLMAMLQSMVKSRRESIEMYTQGNRPELAAKEQGEIDVIMGFLPKQLSADETRAIIAGVITATGASSVKDMGKVMAELKAKYTGQIDFGIASPLVKEMLG